LNRGPLSLEVLSSQDPSRSTVLMTIPVNGGQPILDGDVQGMHWLDCARLLLVFFSLFPVWFIYKEACRMRDRSEKMTEVYRRSRS